MSRAEQMRASGSFDLARAIVLILLPVLIIGALLSRNIGDEPLAVIDYGPILASAQAEAPYPVLAPEGLPVGGDRGWTPTVARWTALGAPGMNDEASPRNSWELGLLSPDRILFAIKQGDQAVPQLIAEATRDGSADGVSLVAGREWERMVSADDRTRSLVSRGEKVTSIVSADAGYAEIEAFAATLSSD